MRFSAGEAAFEGFRVTRHHPAALLGWAMVWLVSLLATALTALPFLSPVSSEAQAVLQNAMAGVQSKQSMALQMQIIYAGWAAMPIGVVTQAILLPAMYRAMSSEGRDRFAFIRLGHDELRALSVLAVIAMVSLILNIISVMAVTLTDKTVFGLLGDVVNAVASLLSIFVAVRLVLATPAAFATGQIDLRSGWRMTKGVFWPLFGMAIIAGVMATIVVLLLSIVALPLWALMGGAPGASATGAAGALGMMLLLGIGAALVMTVVSAPFMAAYREMTTGV